jgi:SWI/SNF-related matrix-associated actin-dependent regulator of chromatin subfamily A member 5
VFANSEQFDEWFNLDIEDADEKNKLIMQLHKILRPFMLRRLKADVEKNLPPKHETILFTGMSALQKKLYRDILLRDFDAIQGHGSSGSRSALLNIVMQLRKCAGHPYLFPGVEDRTLPPLGEHLVNNCGKMVLLDKLLKRLKERGHRVLVFTQMTRILDIMEDYMVMRQYQYCRIDGNTNHDLREEYIDAYNAPNSEKFVFLLSTRAGGLGINLQTADIVILYDSDWNPQADLQAQDRAHRIGQKRQVQVFRLVTEHTIEEKVVERAQQKLKLDAMVVQQGRLKDKDKLSRDELLEAVRFGADKVFKSKDSSITDDDIDLILSAGKRKTQELNEKLKNAEKGDMLDFKLDGQMSSQTYEGVDYSKAAQIQSELFGIVDIGKRERRTVAYNENQLYQQQISAIQGAKKKEKMKQLKLPKELRLPRMEEWQMYNRTALQQIQEEEEAAFKALPEEVQKLATQKGTTQSEAVDLEIEAKQEPREPFVLPPLLSQERQAEKERLLAEAFSDWSRQNFSGFIRGSAKYGRNSIDKISVEVGKPYADVKKFSEAFWDDNIGKKRFSEHEYERVVKVIERGEKKMEDIKEIVRGTAILISIFDNPWEDLEFTFVNAKDKMFSADEDRHLLCWAHKVT